MSDEDDVDERLEPTDIEREIERVLNSYSDDPEVFGRFANDVYIQMPITLFTLDRPVEFEELVVQAARDITRDVKRGSSRLQ